MTLSEIGMNRFVRLQELKSITGLSKSSIYKYMDDGDFPLQRKLGPNSVGWLYSDIMDWLESRQRADCVAGGTIKTGLMLGGLFGAQLCDSGVYL
tara:strand:+ start:701 stop:985 length:285 start_codon:yes stop_codon:yes gene_type:complete